MIAYASRTGTRRNLDALRSAGWRLLVSARGVLRHEGFAYALDNGAWTSHKRGEPFNVKKFEVAVDRLGAGADWIAAPDIVEGGIASLEMSIEWLPRLLTVGPVLIPVQDGMEPGHLWSLLGPRVGIFVGGSTAWKLGTLQQWGTLGRDMRCHVHVGRVNTVRRIRLAQDAGAHSFDGSSATRWSKSLPRLNNANGQGYLPW